MNRKTILAILLTASLAGNAAFLVTAFFRRSTQHIGAIDQLSLTEDQKSKFETKKQLFQDERTVAHKKMAVLRGVLADEFLKDTPDRQRLVSAAVEMAQVQTNMRPKLIDHLLALHALVTPAQRATLASIMRTGGGNGATCPGAMLFSTPNEER